MTNCNSYRYFFFSYGGLATVKSFQIVLRPLTWPNNKIATRDSNYVTYYTYYKYPYNISTIGTYILFAFLNENFYKRFSGFW